MRRSHPPAPPARASRGFTLVEMLVVVALLAAFAGMAVPALNSQGDQRLDVAASEVRDALRLARAEALRRGNPVLVDAETAPGKIKLFSLTASSPFTAVSCASYSSSTVVTDPRTKSAFLLDVSGGAFSGGVALNPRFLAGGTAYAGLFFNADGVATAACQVAAKSSKGSPEAGSGVLLTLGERQLVVSLDAATGRVTIP